MQLRYASRQQSDQSESISMLTKLCALYDRDGGRLPIHADLDLHMAGITQAVVWSAQRFLPDFLSLYHLVFIDRLRSTAVVVDRLPHPLSRRCKLYDAEVENDVQLTMDEMQKKRTVNAFLMNLNNGSQAHIMVVLYDKLAVEWMTTREGWTWDDQFPFRLAKFVAKRHGTPQFSDSIRLPKLYAALKRKSAFNRCMTCAKEESQSVKLSRCSRCRLAGYCSKECQRQDWQDEHKLACAHLAARKALMDSCSSVTTYQRFHVEEAAEFQRHCTLSDESMAEFGRLKAMLP